MLVGRCSWELSDRKLHRKIKKLQTLSGAPSQIYRVSQCLVARNRRACPGRSRRNPEGAHLTHAVRAFSTTEAREQDLTAVPT